MPGDLLWMALRPTFRCFAGLCTVLMSCAFGLAGGTDPVVTTTTFDQPVQNILWVGPHSQTLLMRTSTGLLHRSTDGGKSWSHITNQIKSGLKINQLIVSPADRSVLAAIGTKNEHYVSQNGGSTWRAVDLPQGKTKLWVFHRTRPDWALYSSWSHSCRWVQGKVIAGEDDHACNHALYATKDLGITFSEISSHVIQYDWGEAPFKDRVYFTTFRDKKVQQPRFDHWMDIVDFQYSDDLGHSPPKTVFHGGNKFVVSHGFVLVATMSAGKLGLMVSADAGANFNKAIMPRHLKESSYIILDTSEGAVVLHVHHGHGIGHVYVSDSTGVHYSLSLENNVRGKWDCAFENVMNLRGIYLANVRNPSPSDFLPAVPEVPNKEDGDDYLGGLSSRTQTDRAIRSLQERQPRSLRRLQQNSSLRDLSDHKSVRTVVSFDMGGAWTYLKAPEVDSKGAKIDCPPDSCWLHLHDITEFDRFAPFYSYTNAVGIIMATGNVGAYLQHNQEATNTYLSRDGGLTWSEASKGDYIYEFGNHGGLLVMADWIHETRDAYYSTNQGWSWQKFEFARTPMKVTNILTESIAMSTNFVIFGTRGSKGVLHHVDFSVIGLRVCKGLSKPGMGDSDYETWTPSDGKNSERCLLGRQKLYTRRKQRAECLNNKDSKWHVNVKNCSCTESDFKCESGFVRGIGSMQCLPEHLSDFVKDDDGNAGVCATADYYDIDSHRKVSGDTCVGGWLPTKFRLSCGEVRSQAAQEAKEAAANASAKHPSQGSTPWTSIFKVAAIVVLAIAAFFASRSKVLRSKVLELCGSARQYSSVKSTRSEAETNPTSFGTSGYQAPPQKPAELQEVSSAA